MRVLFEGAKYEVTKLQKLFGEKFYHQNGNNAFIDIVGYYHSANNELYYFLPKLFLTEKDCFLDTGIHYLKFYQTPIESLLEYNIHLLNWFRKFLILFYKSLKEYNKRIENNIVLVGETLQLSTNVGKNEHTFLDLVLTILNFYKKNKNFFVFHTKQLQSKKHKKVNWNKTVMKQQPIFINQTPIYDRPNVKVKEINTDEILMIYFYSVLKHLKDEYKIDLAFECPYDIIKGERFKDFLDSGYYKLKKIKNNYYSDKLREIHSLLSFFLEKTSESNIRAKKSDFIMVREYHYVFEDMIDKLLSDPLSDITTSNGYSLKLLKNNQDGKVIDHLFEFESVLDSDESIFYIGDSKYYKHKNTVTENSIYKQFTYAKNVIQFNIDILNDKATIPSQINSTIRYRDELTEGYSISPNFFIQGVIENINDFETDGLKQNKIKGIEVSAHFKERLFDRDTLFVKYYKINFLYILHAYTNFSESHILTIRQNFKKKFKKHFQSYFKNNSNFKFYEFCFESQSDLEIFIDTEFRNLTGRMIRTLSKPNRIIVAVNDSEEKSLGKRSLLNIFNNSLEVPEYKTDSKSKPRIVNFNFG